MVLEFTTNHIYGVREWVLSLGADATVLAPAALAAEVKAEFKRAVANYRK